MKGYKKNSGWLISCKGGPLDHQHIRGYNLVKKYGDWIECDLDWSFKMCGQDDGRYILKPLNLATGERRKAKHKGVEADAWYYEWEPA